METNKSQWMEAAIAAFDAQERYNYTIVDPLYKNIIGTKNSILILGNRTNWLQ